MMSHSGSRLRWWCGRQHWGRRVRQHANKAVSNGGRCGSNYSSCRSAHADMGGMSGQCCAAHYPWISPIHMGLCTEARVLFRSFNSHATHVAHSPQAKQCPNPASSCSISCNDNLDSPERVVGAGVGAGTGTGVGVGAGWGVGVGVGPPDPLQA